MRAVDGGDLGERGVDVMLAMIFGWEGRVGCMIGGWKVLVGRLAFKLVGDCARGRRLGWSGSIVWEKCSMLRLRVV